MFEYTFLQEYEVDLVDMCKQNKHILVIRYELNNMIYAIKFMSHVCS